MCQCNLSSAKSGNSQIMTEFGSISFQRLWSTAKVTAVWGTHNYAEYSKFITENAPYQVSKSKFLFCLQIKCLT